MLIRFRYSTKKEIYNGYAVSSFCFTYQIVTVGDTFVVIRIFCTLIFFQHKNLHKHKMRFFKLLMNLSVNLCEPLTQ